MAILPIRAHAFDGFTVSFEVAQAGDQLPIDEKIVLRAKNTGPAPLTITFPAVGKCSVGRTHDLQVSIPNDSIEYDIGFFRSDRFGGLISLIYSATAGLQVAAVRYGIAGQGAGTHVTSTGSLGSRSILSEIQPHGDIGDVGGIPGVAPNLAQGNALFLDHNVYLLVWNGSVSTVTPKLRASVPSNHGFLHDSAGNPIGGGGAFRRIGLFSGERWGSPLLVDWTGGAAGIEIALVRFGNLDGFGVDIDTPPAMGASPVAVPVVGEDVPPDIVTQGVAAVADGGTLTLLGPSRVMARATAGTRTLWVRATRRCSHGFLDDLSVSIPNGTTVTTLELPPSRFGPTAELQWDATAGLTVLGVAARTYSG